MGKTKKAAGNDKKLAKKLVQEQALARQATIRDAYLLGDPFTHLSPFAAFNRNGLTATLEYATPEELTKAEKEWMSDLLGSNMRQHYEEEWPTVELDKNKEMMESDARFILVRLAEGSQKDDQENAKVPNESTAPAIAADASLPVAFAQYRFVEDEELEVLYVYELQLTSATRRKGMGKFLMQLLELLARKSAMKGVMLTVQKINRSALRFYQSLNYKIDETSPSLHDPLDDSSYEIMSKMWDHGANKLVAG